MQIAFELPDELGKQLLQRPNHQQFVQQAVEKMLIEDAKLQAKQTLLMLMAKIPSSINLADELIKERRLETEKKQSDNPLFGIWQDNSEVLDVDAYVRQLRKGRFHVG